MTTYSVRPEDTRDAVLAALGDKVQSATIALGEVKIIVAAQDYLAAAQLLRDAKGCQFEQLIDLCGVDYSEYKDSDNFEVDEGSDVSHVANKPRFCVVSHLLSVSLNQRLRLAVYAPDEGMPMVASVTSVWSAADWFEREAFDLFGIVFDGHTDLRRILTDYGFIGHPFRKDFPLTGHVEMRYDEKQARVVYQPVTVEPREITPRIIREDNYGGLQ